MTPELVNFTDYADCSPRDLHKVICGDSKSGFHPKVRGTVEFEGEAPAVVTVAFYEIEKISRAEAAKCATAMLKLVKARS